MLWARDKSAKKKKSSIEVRDIKIIATPAANSLFYFFVTTSSNSVFTCNLYIRQVSLPHPFAYFLFSGYLLRILDNSTINLFSAVYIKFWGQEVSDELILPVIGEVAGRVEVAGIDVVLGDEFAPRVALVAIWIKK